ncbi:hypothetical protein [Chryseobacterium indologenes]|uniref:hypothetical protein n=1 Tax=Chryseobacterium indologenes TaxID=253 RepID=UPI00076E3F3B|nr:hypothetical protein [Chryseobacterium indologenes]
MNLQLSLKKQWFEMTKAGIKTEDYREITPYWIKRLTDNDIDLTIEEIESGLCALRDGYSEDHVWEVYGFCLKIFDINTMTLGYPSKDDQERILKLEHKGIEIRKGNPEWGAEPGKLYFVIKHGKML